MNIFDNITNTFLGHTMEDSNFSSFFEKNDISQFNDNFFDDYESQIMKSQGFLELTKVVTSTLEESKLQQVILYASHGQYLIKNASIILLNKDFDAQIYEDALSTGLKETQYNIQFEAESDLIKLFTKEESSGDLRMAKFPHLAMQVFADLNWSKENNLLSPLKPEIIIPLWGRSAFLGFFILGAKLNDIAFTQEEFESLSQFSELVAFSIENARLFDMAILDNMTGLFNHHFFKTCLASEMKKAKKKKESLCLVMCDLDHFKSVNDTYGHQVGDFILKTFSRVIKRILDGRYIAARYGGEEFAIIFSNTTLAQTMEMAEKIRTSFEKIKYHTKKGNFVKTTSMGITEYDFNENPSLIELIEMTDKALYHSKNTGRNKITVSSQENF